MSLWGVHVGLAVLVTSLVLYVIEPPRVYRWTIVAASGFWAIVPDMYWVFPSLRPVLKPNVHDTALANLFWFHGWIDLADSGDSVPLSLAFGALGIVVLLAVEVKLEAGRDD